MFFRRNFLLILIPLFLILPLTAESDKATEAGQENVYYKAVHPREYKFDMYDFESDFYFTFNKKLKMFDFILNFTDLLKKDMPKAGDKICIYIKGTSSKDISGINAILITDNKEDLYESHNFVNNIKEKEEFEGYVSFIVKEDVTSKVEVKFYSTISDKLSKIHTAFFKLERVIESTDTKAEAKKLKNAQKKKMEIIELQAEIIDDYADGDNISSISLKTESSESEESVTLPPPVKEENINDIKEEIESPDQITAVTAQTETTKEAQNEIIIETENEDEKANEELERLYKEAEKLKKELEKEREEKNELKKSFDEEKNKLQEEIQQLTEINKEKQSREKKEASASKKKTVSKKNKKETLLDYLTEDEEISIEEENDNTELIANPDEADIRGTTILMKASRSGNEWLVKKLIDSGADVNKKDKDGWSALMYAVRYNEGLDCVKQLITAGAKIKEKNNYETSILTIAACYNNNPQIIDELLKSYSSIDKEVLQSFVFMLSEENIPENVLISKIQSYLKAGVPLNSYYQGKTPLMYAAMYGNSTKAIKLLIDNDASTTKRSTEGKTAFDYAVKNTSLTHDKYYWALNNN